MITFVFTYRNRELRIVENCLNSLAAQNLKDFKVILVDYGSDLPFAEELKSLVQNYEFIKYISCPVKYQLWSKCRAINIALKETTTPYFMVGDIDLIFDPGFVKIVTSHCAADRATYYQYGFLDEKESKRNTEFKDYKVAFKGSDEVTGTTVFPTDKLKAMNGYDEFYHGWGAEDTDIHIRLRNYGLQVNFYDEAILVKHQWHPKAYRSKGSTKPFHSNLERINQRYMLLTQQTNRTRVNLDGEWGKLPDVQAYRKLELAPDHTVQLMPVDRYVASLLAQLKNYKNEVVAIEVRDIGLQQKWIQKLKKLLNKKHDNILPMELVNNLLLEEIIKNYRNLPYAFNFDRIKKVIKLTIVF